MRAWRPWNALTTAGRGWKLHSSAHSNCNFSSAAHHDVPGGRGQQLPSPKGELRRLFKLVHPDLFQNHPVEQATNQHSFQLLQEYLNAAREGQHSQQDPFHFTFYIRHEADAENLKKVEVSLPPPQNRHADRGEEDTLLGIQRAIAHLLSACGLSDSMPLSGGFSVAEEQIRLSEFFQQASEIQRQNDASSTDFERQLAGIKNALRLGRGIRVSFRPPVSEMSSQDRIESLEKLAVALDKSPDVNLKGHALLIGDCYGVDALGNIWLRYEDDVLLWSNFLNRVDLEKSAKNQKAASLRRVLEHKAARLMEVEMIFTHDTLAVNPDYTLFLNRIIDEAASYGAVRDGKFFNLPVRIICPEKKQVIDGSTEMEAENSSHMKVDQTFGYVAVPVWETLPNIYRYIEQHGHEALDIRERLKKSEKHVEQVKLVVRRKLRLRHLVFDQRLKNEMCMAACMRLIHFAPELERHMEGLSLCISDEHRLPVEGTKSFVHLKWNFSLAEL